MRPSPSRPTSPLAPRARRLRSRRSRARGLGALALVATAVLTLGACGGGSGTSASSLSRPEPGVGAPQQGQKDVAGGSAGSTAPGGEAATSADAASVDPAGLDRRVVRTADLTIRTTDVAGASARVRAAVAAAQGFVADEKTMTTPPEPGAPQPADRVAHTESLLVLRVPTNALDDVLDRVSAVGTVVGRTQSSQDVTTTYVDTQSRVQTQTASVERVRVLLSKATSIGDVVRIEGELAKRESDLESLQAQLAALRSQTSLSTLTVTLSPNPVVVAPKHPREAGFVGGLTGGWTALVATLTVVLTVVGAVLPFALLVAVVGLPVLLVLRRRRRVAPAGQPVG